MQRNDSIVYMYLSNKLSFPFLLNNDFYLSVSQSCLRFLFQTYLKNFECIQCYLMRGGIDFRHAKYQVWKSHPRIIISQNIYKKRKYKRNRTKETWMYKPGICSPEFVALTNIPLFMYSFYLYIKDREEIMLADETFSFNVVCFSCITDQIYIKTKFQPSKLETDLCIILSYWLFTSMSSCNVSQYVREKVPT